MESSNELTVDSIVAAFRALSPADRIAAFGQMTVLLASKS
jgi:hypothetical protein